MKIIAHIYIVRPVQKYNVTYGFEKERCEYIYILSLRNIYHNCEIVIYHGEEHSAFSCESIEM